MRASSRPPPRAREARAVTEGMGRAAMEEKVCRREERNAAVLVARFSS